MSDNQLAVQSSPIVSTLDEMERVSKQLSASGLLGVTKPEQVFGLMLLCQAENINPVLALRRYHIIEGKPSMRADAMQGEFEKEGAILWHVRDDFEVSATLFRHKATVDEKAQERAATRYGLMLDIIGADAAKAREINRGLAKLARVGEATVIWTIADAHEKGISTTTDVKGQVKTRLVWSRYPRQMLSARCVTEGVRLVYPGLIAGIYSEEELSDTKEVISGYSEEPATLFSMSLEALRSSERKEAEAISQGKGSQARLNDIRDRIIDLEENEQKGGDASCSANAHAISEQTQTVRSTDAKPAGSKAGQRSEPSAPAVAIETWPQVVCHIGKANGPLLGKSLQQLFIGEGGKLVKIKSAKRVMEFFDTFSKRHAEAIAGGMKDEGPMHADFVLAEALVFARKYIEEQEALHAPPAGEAQVVPASEEIGPTKAVSERSTGAPGGWRSAICPIGGEFMRGRQLGDFCIIELEEAVKCLKKYKVEDCTPELKEFSAKIKEMRAECGFLLDRDELRQAVQEECKKHEIDVIELCQVMHHKRELPSETFHKLAENDLRNVLRLLPNYIPKA